MSTTEKQKVLIIKYCGDCCWQERNTCTAMDQDRDLKCLSEIPSWCPLPDKEKP